MEPLFINKHIRDKANIEEMYTNTVLRQPIMYIAYGIEGLLILINIVNVFLYGTADFFSLITAAVVAVTLFVTLKVSVNKAVRQVKELSGGEPPEIITEIYEDRLHAFSANGHNDIEWESIKKAHLTKNLILLRTRANVIFVMTKSGFTKGTYQGFCQFLREKGILKK